MEPGKMEKTGTSRKKGQVFRLETFVRSLKFSYEIGDICSLRNPEVRRVFVNYFHNRFIALI